jgi:glycosyltransferase involved in cell wall biosynthesis
VKSKKARRTWKMKLNLVCERNKTSYGYHASYTAHYLLKKGHDVREVSIFGRDNPIDHIFHKDTMSREFHYDSPSLMIWHQDNLTKFVGSGEKFAFTAFELETLSSTEVHSMRYPDLLLVPSEWAVSVCKAHNVRALSCPLGFEPSIFSPKEEEMAPSEVTIFGNFGKWEVRKGHDILIDAFNAAFDKEDNVILAMMPHNFFLSQEQTEAWHSKYLKSKLGSKIRIIPRMDTQFDVSNVMRQIHCAVFPARAEGWNLEALECMALGKDVIITDCTGHKEFIDDSCKLIDMPDIFERAEDGVFFNGRSHWRKFEKDSFDQLVNHLRVVHKNRLDRKQNVKAINKANEFTWEKSISKLEQRISL